MEAVDRAVGIQCQLHIILHVGGPGDVGGDKQRFATLLTQDAGGGLARCLIAVYHHNLGAPFGKAECRGTTDAVARAGDQGDLAVEVHRFLASWLSLWAN
jgi:hypothetical protein